MGFYPFASSKPPNWVNVANYGVDLTGTNDSSTGLLAAIAAMPSGGGRLYIPSGSTIKFSQTLSFIQDQGIFGDGSDCVTLHYTGSGTALSISIQGTFTGGQYAGTFEGFYIDGYSAGGSAVGIKYGNLQGLHMRDVRVYGFGGVGIYFVNAGGNWAEQGNVQAQVTQCGTANSTTSAAVIFDTGSFDYSNFDFLIGATTATGGVYLQNGAKLQGAQLRMRGNFYGAVTNTAAVLGIDVGNTSGTSVIWAFFDVAVETDGSNTGHYTVLMGGTSASCQLTGTGVLSFTNNTINFRGASIPGSAIFGFSGVLNDTVLGEMAQGDAAVFEGGTQWSAPGSLTLNPSGNLYFQFGDVYEFRLNNGSNSLTFHGTSNYIKRVDLWIAQPATGAAGTVSWPSVKWASAAAPTLSSTNGYVDHVRLTYLPDTAAWYGELVGTHYA